MEQIGTEFARAFPVHSNFSWCTHEGYKMKRNRNVYRFRSPKGLLYVKVPKAASSTTASVWHRIARNNGNCNIVWEHGQGKYYGNRDKSASFLLGSIQNPASRAISRVFFTQASQRKEESTDANVLKWLNTTDGHFGAISEGQGGFQLRYMGLDPLKPWGGLEPRSSRGG